MEVVHLKYVGGVRRKLDALKRVILSSVFGTLTPGFSCTWLLHISLYNGSSKPDMSFH